MTDQTTARIEQVDPAQAVIGTNVRRDARLDKAFVASIRERGVLEPVVGYRDEDGRFVVLRGQRRTLAAVEAKRATIPAYVGASPEDADRIIDQLAENEHRAAMSTGERVAALARLHRRLPHRGHKPLRRLHRPPTPGTTQRRISATHPARVA